MKKGLALLVLLNLIWLMNSTVSAQIKGVKRNPGIERVLIKYAGMEAVSDGQGVLIEWETEMETRNLGFYIYRISDGRQQLVNASLIPGAYLKTRAAQNSENKYSFFDEKGDLSSVYFIESLNASGQKSTSGLISAKYISDSAVTLEGFENFKRKAGKANPNAFKNEMILPEDLKSEVEANNPQADFNKQRWVAAQPGVKIGVKSEGFYRVTRAQLQAAGFDVTSSPALWQLYMNGVEQATNVGGNGDYIEFYGKGLDTRDTDTQIYFLVAGAQNGKRIGNSFLRRLASPVQANSYQQSFLFKERTIYSSGIFNGDATDNFFGRVINSAGAAIPLNLTAVNFAVAASSIDIAVQGVTQVPHQVKVTLNGTDIGTLTGNGANSMTGHFDIPTSVLLEGANNLQLTPLNGTQDISFFDTIKINYARGFKADQNRLSFFTANYRTSYLEGFSSPNIRVFDITSPDNVSLIANLQIQQSNGAYRVYLPSSRGRVMYAVEDSAIMQAASIVPNAPSTLSTTAHNANLIIISYKDWMAQANDWANYRRAQGTKVEVVNVEDIYDEFNYGVYSADSLESFLQYAKNNWQTPPSYTLLLGDATYDPRNYTGNGLYNYIPTKMVETIYLETGSDEALADFNNEGLAQIAMGRIPAQNSQDVTLALNKTSAFEQTVATQGLSRGVIFASDLPNGYDFAGSSNRLRSQLPSNVPTVMINKGDTDARTTLLNELNNGRFIVNYSGHGNTGAWGSSPAFFSKTDIPGMTNGNNLSIFTLLTCLNGYFISPTDSLAEVLLKKQGGGAVAVWASTGETTPDIQEIMATRFFSQVGGNNTMRLGDLIKDAKTTISGGRDVRLSWALLGDPTLKVR